MRVTKEKAAENRDRIVEAASRLIRERGISGAGVDALTDAAGMTHGSLYSQFGSKERLVEEALAHALAVSGKATAGAATLDQYIDSYLSCEHRDRPGLRDAAPGRQRASDVHGWASGPGRKVERPDGCGPEAAPAGRESVGGRRVPDRSARARPRGRRSQTVGRHPARHQKGAGRLIAG
jgi:AcrR family transcriptional regulator